MKKRGKIYEAVDKYAALRALAAVDRSDVVLTGVETRTSAPVRILRTESYNMLNDDSVYPCGEGAGYAGGIMSASVDGINVALAILNKG